MNQRAAYHAKRTYTVSYPEIKPMHKDDREVLDRGEPALVKTTNIGDIMNYMMIIPTKEEAVKFYERVIAWSLENWNVKQEATDANARKLLNKNLKYWSGYAARWGIKVKELYGL